MSSRDKILQSVRNNLPAAAKLPEDPYPDSQTLDLADKFALRLESIGGLARLFPSRKEAIEEINLFEKSIILRDLVRGADASPSSEEPDVTIIEARYAIAENGAVYVTDEEISSQRNNLFLGNKLIALVPREQLLADMHEAYVHIDLTSVGFGIFIAGPSATADIAQILVRGAHGPAQMEVWMYGSEI